MSFNESQAAELLAACHRRCSVCHRFCGVKMELDHIVQRADEGPDDIENAIPVCFECHAEMKLYNVKHPLGRKFRPNELRLHKQQWLDICKANPTAIMDNPRVRDIGPLHSLIDELEFNRGVSASYQTNLGCPFEVRQFDRALHEGLISILEPALRDSLYRCYQTLKKANQSLQRYVHLHVHGSSGSMLEEAKPHVQKAGPSIDETLSLLSRFLTEPAGQVTE